MNETIEKIKAALADRNLSVVAALSGVPYSMVRSIALGRALSLRPQHVDMLATYLGLAVECGDCSPTVTRLSQKRPAP